jgi:hypothetical protein
VPVVPGKYTGLYVTNTQVNGPRTKMLALNYADGTTTVMSARWADWCNPNGAAPDFFTWSPTHRLAATPQEGVSCALITKFVPVDANRVLTSVTLGTDSPDNGGGITGPGDTLTGSNGRTIIGGLTLVSTDPNLGGYGFVSGHVMDSSGKVLTTPEHTGVAGSTGETGADVFVLSPALGNYGAAANVDGTYTLGLPAGTYTLSAAARDGAGPGTGPQATPVTVTVTAGKTTTQDIQLLASPDPNQWGELTGTVKDASGKAIQGVALLFSDNANGPFAARAIPITDSSQDGTTQADGAFDIKGLNATKPIFVRAAGNGYASDQATMVALKPGGSTAQDITVAVAPVGNVQGVVETPDAQFGGIGVPVILTSKDTTLTTTTVAVPAATSGTGRLDETGLMAAFTFTGVPAGDYTLTLPASAVQGKAVDAKVTVTAGQTVTPTLTLAYPDWNEGTADTKISDPLTGTALDAKWTVADIGSPSAAGTAKEDSSGLTVMADGKGWDIAGDTAGDGFNYVYQTVPAGDWAAYVTVTAVPTMGTSASGTETISPGGEAGLMVASSADPTAAHFVIADTNGEGVVAQSRQAAGTNRFPFAETASGTDASNGGTQPSLPVALKIRKVGANFAGFYSTDGGKTQHLIGNLAPQFDPGAMLLLGLATTSDTDGTLDTAKYQGFVFAPLAAAPPTAGP